MLVFVYGSLIRNLHNHHYLGDSELVGCGTTFEKFTMFDLGEYPGINRSDRCLVAIRGEVYQIDKHTLVALDQLEEHPDYYLREKTQIELQDGQIVDCIVYLLLEKEESDVIVDTGDWVEYLREK